jgi:hypothetical protein
VSGVSLLPPLTVGDGEPVGGGGGGLDTGGVDDGVGVMMVGVGVAVGGGGGGPVTGDDQLMVTVSPPGMKAKLPPGANATVACPEASCARLTVTVTVTGWPGRTVPPPLLSVRSGDDVWADQETGPPTALSVISPVEPVPRASWVGETCSRPPGGGGPLPVGLLLGPGWDGLMAGPWPGTGVPRR